MNFTTLSRRVLATSGVTALAAAALVGGTTTAANADPVVNNEYTCAFGETTFPVFLTTNAPGLEAFPSIGAGSPIGAGLLSVTNVFTIPEAIYGALAGFNVETVSVPDFAGSFGGTPIGVEGVSVTIAEFTDNGNGTYSSNPEEGTGVNEAFEVPAAGEYDVLSPSTLDLVASTSAGGEIPVSCVIKEGTEPGAYHHIVVTKNTPTVSGSAVAKTLKTTKATKLKVTVDAPHTATGKVVVKEGKKTLGDATLKNGKATVNLGKLKKGEHTVKIQYKGDDYTTKGAGEATFTVKKG